MRSTSLDMNTSDLTRNITPDDRVGLAKPMDGGISRTVDKKKVVASRKTMRMCVARPEGNVKATSRDYRTDFPSIPMLSHEAQDVYFNGIIARSKEYASDERPG